MTRSGGDIVVVVFAGGCVGGYTRYAVTSAWTSAAHGFPWPTLCVNVAGAFILALAIVVAEQVRRHRYLRPLVGTGFCGALTTFGSVVVAADELFAHHHTATAIAYLAATTGLGLAAAVAGLRVGHAVAARSAVGRR